MHSSPLTTLLHDPNAGEDDPLVAPLMREQLEELVGGRRDNGAGAQERALMRAMLQDAVLCLLGEAAPAKDRVRLAAEARFWIESRSHEWIFAFESVCEALGIEPGYARAQLLALAERRGAIVESSEKPAPERRGLRGLRHGGQRPRRAIHFMVERRGRKRGRRPANAELAVG
ncbi:MAG: hypothetical protein SF182_02190 [Deltaproteobacteria bacterium]|nr:hypothetical protein [Deltaproteobacteria bacterium]